MNYLAYKCFLFLSSEKHFQTGRQSQPPIYAAMVVCNRDMNNNNALHAEEYA